MAKNVIGIPAGGSKQVLDNVFTVQEAFTALKLEGNYTAAINGDPANMTDGLDDGDVVSFAQAVKGGQV